jgi:hypothetical protein
MLFDQKIKYLIEVLNKKPIIDTPFRAASDDKKLGSDGQTIAGYQPTSAARGLDMNEEKIKTAITEFQKNKDPELLNNVLTFVEGSPHVPLKFSGKWIKGNELKKMLIDKFFTVGKKDYIDYPKDENGVVLRNVDFQREVKINPKFAQLKSNPIMWLKVLFKLLPIDASDRRQESGSYSEKVPYFTKGGVVRAGRVHVVDGKVSPTPFGGRFSYNNKYQAFTPKGEPIPYEQISGGITLDEFKKILHSEIAKSKNI